MQFRNSSMMLLAALIMLAACDGPGRQDLIDAEPAASPESDVVVQTGVQPAPAPDPAALVNYQWTVMHSKKGPNSPDDCTSPECLWPNDVFTIESGPGPIAQGDDVKLRIGRGTQHFPPLDAEVCDYSGPSGGTAAPNAWILIGFEDVLADAENPPIRRMRVMAQRMHAGPGKRQCMARLRGQLSGLNEDEREHACGQEHLVSWTIRTVKRTCPGPGGGAIEPMGPPENGAGTGSGGGFGGG